ncbi:MAG TPA: hypothetical protein VIY48_09590 [Candidatus Paceibacterota bacterium]
MFQLVMFDEETQDEMIKAYVPDAELYSHYDAFTLALIKDLQAARDLLWSVFGV